MIIKFKWEIKFIYYNWTRLIIKLKRKIKESRIMRVYYSKKIGNTSCFKIAEAFKSIQSAKGTFLWNFGSLQQSWRIRSTHICCWNRPLCQLCYISAMGISCYFWGSITCLVFRWCFNEILVWNFTPQTSHWKSRLPW